MRSVSEGENYRFEGLPAELDGGTVTFTLDNADGGDVPHEMQIVQVDKGTTFDQVRSGLLEEEGAPLPDFVGETLGGIGNVAPGARAATTQKLASGTYVYFCAFSDEESDDAPAHYEQGMEGTFTVSGSGAKADEPDTVGSVTTKDYGFEFDGVKAGTNVVEFKNDGKEYHHMIAAPLNTGASVQHAIAAFQSEEEPEGPPPVDFEKAVQTAVIGPGQEIRTQLELGAGTYVVACFISDRAGGPPHVAKGMITSTQIT